MARCGTKSALRNSRGAWDDSAVAALKIGGSVSRPSVFRYNLWSFLPPISAPLAQLDRASGYEPEGREFESLRAHQISPGSSALNPRAQDFGCGSRFAHAPIAPQVRISHRAHQISPGSFARNPPAH